MKIEEMLRLEAERLRLLDLQALTRAGSGHPGGTLSLAEVMSVLFFGGVLRHDPARPDWEYRDRLVLSEGHSAPILYAALTEAGVRGWSRDALMDLRQNPDVIAQGHTTRGLTPGVDCSTGALGMGGSKALGMALAARYKGLDYHTFAIIGDGEAEEGQTYEAAANAALVGADNLTWILNRNKAQQTAGIHDLSPVRYERLFAALGWNVVVLNGESAEPSANRRFIARLRQTLLAAKARAGKARRPTVVIADTIKGKGVSFMEYRNHKPGEYKFHGVAPTPEQLEKALPLIEKRMGRSPEAALGALMRQAAVSPEALQRVEETNRDRADKRRRQLEAVRAAAAPVPFPDFHPGDKPSGTREGFGQALAHLAARHPEIVATSPDLQDSVQMFPFEKVTGRHGPARPTGAYFPEGISESNAFGKCAGLGYEGLIPFVGTFDNFTLEAADELQHASAFGSFYVAVGTHSGCGVGPDGKSQMGVATPAVVDHYSGMEGELFDMYEPADSQEAAEITRLIVDRALRGKRDHPVYLRCTRHKVGHLDRSGIPDYLKRLAEGSYVLPTGRGPFKAIVVASGATVHHALEAARALGAEGAPVKVINAVSINKIARADSPFVREYLEDGVPILTVHDAEPHALGHRVKDAVNAARLIGRSPGPVVRTLGVNISPHHTFVGSGTDQENYRRNQLDAAGIRSALQDVLKTPLSV